MVDIVIVNWNSEHYLSRCIHSILSSTSMSLISQIIIIDNASTDNSLSILPNHAKIKIIQNHVNQGFAAACNQGFRLSNAQYVLLLNPDVVVKGLTLQQCFDFMESRNDIDILGCQLLNEAGKITASCARFPTPLKIFFDASGLSKIAPRIFKPATLMTDWNHKTSRKVPQVMGAFMWMRRNVFEKIGYFDERFFVYFEELDFSKRLSDAGGISFFNAVIQAIHSGGGTTDAVKSFRLFLFLDSRLKYAKKYFSAIGFYFVRFSTFMIEPVTRIIFSLLRGDIKSIKELAGAYRMLIEKRHK